MHGVNTPDEIDDAILTDKNEQNYSKEWRKMKGNRGLLTGTDRLF
ncbi:hypothetical protein VIBNIAM115_1210084 [Vibrio nigripulchritudo AM115]|nr:hypothetical protein VIBNIAM115_1210084 [Vibrio nigripulchritudo AM115]